MSQYPLAHLLAAASDEERVALLAGLSPEVKARLRSDWTLWARPKQLAPPGAWRIWLLLTGRGWGKGKAGSNWLASQALTKPGEYAIIAPTFSMARTVCVEGESGIVAALPPSEVLTYNRASYELKLRNGSGLFVYGAETPERGPRGRNLAGAWCDELGSWPYPDTWHASLMPALRKSDARVCVTTTPRNTPLLRELAARTDGTVALTRGSIWENAANLSPLALAELERRYGGTPLGRQELEGELIDEVEGALWSRATIDACRIPYGQPVPSLSRILVGVDPSGGTTETGIVVAGVGTDGHAYVLEDATVGGNPDHWASAVVAAYKNHHANLIVAEANHGGEMVRKVIQTADPNVPIRLVSASRGKWTRAEPISALYAQRRVHHVGALPRLEDEMTMWTPGESQSPNRLDALVWAITELNLTGGRAGRWAGAWSGDVCEACGKSFRNASRRDGRLVWVCTHCGHCHEQRPKIATLAV